MPMVVGGMEFRRCEQRHTAMIGFVEDRGKDKDDRAWLSGLLQQD